MESTPQQLSIPAAPWQRSHLPDPGDSGRRCSDSSSVVGTHTFKVVQSSIQLGEVLQARTFQASGEVNPLAKPNRSSTKRTIADNELIQENEPVWNPRSVLAIIDGLNSVRWTYVFTGLGEEVAVNEWFDWLIRLCRSRPAKTDQMSQFYLMSSWKLCMDLRSGKSFEESTKVLMRDYI